MFLTLDVFFIVIFSRSFVTFGVKFFMFQLKYFRIKMAMRNMFTSLNIHSDLLKLHRNITNWNHTYVNKLKLIGSLSRFRMIANTASLIQFPLNPLIVLLYKYEEKNILFFFACPKFRHNLCFSIFPAIWQNVKNRKYSHIFVHPCVFQMFYRSRINF